MRKRRPHNTDLNQPDIIDALTKIGCSIDVIGEPVDLLVGYQGRNFLIECKCPQRGAFTPQQKHFFESWKGQVRKATSAEEAIKLVTEAYKST